MALSDFLRPPRANPGSWLDPARIAALAARTLDLPVGDVPFDPTTPAPTVYQTCATCRGRGVHPRVRSRRCTACTRGLATRRLRDPGTRAWFAHTAPARATVTALAAEACARYAALQRAMTLDAKPLTVAPSVWLLAPDDPALVPAGARLGLPPSGVADWMEGLYALANTLPLAYRQFVQDLGTIADALTDAALASGTPLLPGARVLLGELLRGWVLGHRVFDGAPARNPFTPLLDGWALGAAFAPWPGDPTRMMVAVRPPMSGA